MPSYRPSRSGSSAGGRSSTTTATLSIASCTQPGSSSNASATSDSNRRRERGDIACSLRRMPGGLSTDLYELNMAASYLRRGMNGPATFSLYVRDMPKQRGFLVATGLDDCLQFLESFAFEEDELAHLRRLGFDQETIDHLGDMRFTGEVWAVPEGRIVHAREPILEVTAPIA